jgi:hypothetical protein
VMAQVDRNLTTVSWVDRLLGLIKNLGRHNLTPLKRNLVPRFDLRIMGWGEELIVSRLQEARILSVEVVFRLPSCFFFRVMTPLDFVHSYCLSSGLSLFLV